MGKKVVKGFDSLINLVIIALLSIMFAFGCYSLWDSNQVYKAADSSNWKMYKPVAQAPQYSFEELQAMNPEVIGWIEVYGTDIDYPVTQATDNMKYVNLDASGQYALSGCPFLDCENSRDFSDFNSIIYGHHMDVPAMFGELDNFGEHDYFASHEYGTLYHDGRLYGLEFFSFLSTDAYNHSVYNVGVTGEAAQQTYLDSLLSQSQQTRNLGVTTDDNIVLLSTCSTDQTNGRFIVAARITDEVHENPFATEDDENTSEWSLWDWLRMVPWWMWFVLVGIIGAVFVWIVRKRRKAQSDVEPGTDVADRL